MSILKRLFGGGQKAQEAPPPPQAQSMLVNAYATARDVQPPAFPHELVGRRDRSDPELAEHLHGFTGYVMSRGDGQMTATRYHLWRHLQRVRNHLSLEVTTHDLPALEAWGLAANAVFFLPDGSVRAPDFSVLISADGQSEPSAALPYQPDAVARRARTLDHLAGMDPKPPASMPPALGEAEAVPRTPAAVLERALALVYVAGQGQAHGTGAPPTPAATRQFNPIGAAALTPNEVAFVSAGAGEQSGPMTWRYEAANTLAWALGFEAARMDDSQTLVDVDTLWHALAPFAIDRGTWGQLTLRPTGEILDALDRSWREHWIARQAHNKGVPLAGLNGDIVSERHVALNWLLSFHNELGAPWDDIDTPT